MTKSLPRKSSRALNAERSAGRYHKAGSEEIVKPEGLMVSGRPLRHNVGGTKDVEPGSTTLLNTSSTAFASRLSQEQLSHIKAYKYGAPVLPRTTDYAKDKDHVGEFLPYSLARSDSSDVPFAQSRMDDKARIKHNKKLEREQVALEELIKWIEIDGEIKLERVETSLYHNYLQEAKSMILITDDMRREEFWEVDQSKDLDLNYQLFLVQHDWAAAFKNATDYDDGTFELPYENCCFEFILSGMRWLCFIKGGTRLHMIGRTKVGWIGPMFSYILSAEGKWTFVGSHKHDEAWGFMFDVVMANIKAICVALDAEAATTVPQQPPERVNRERVKRGEKPLDAYHVVSLTQRTKSYDEHREQHEPSYHVRLHFRRGHWRHYHDETAHDHTWLPTPDALGRHACTGCIAYRRWLKWMLVGDPDLGFIDKHYKL